jgi:hypothetical protein
MKKAHCGTKDRWYFFIIIIIILFKIGCEISTTNKSFDFNNFYHPNILLSVDSGSISYHSQFNARYGHLLIFLNKQSYVHP